MNQIKLTHTNWKFSSLFKNDNDPKIEEEKKLLLEKSKEFINKWKGREDYLKDPEVLKEALDEFESWDRNYGSSGNQGYYFSLRSEQDLENPDLKAKNNKIHDLAVNIHNNIQFFTHNISKIPEKEQNKFLDFKGLKEYKHFLEKLFKEAKHLLSEPEETILSLKGTVSHSNWVRMTDEFISKEEREIIDENKEKKVKNFSEIMSLTSSRNKATRDSAATALNEVFKKHIEVGEAEINSILQNKKVDDELRKFPRPDSARHLDDDIDTSVVDALINSVSAKFSLSRRFYGLKAKLMGVKKLKYHERNVPYGHVEKNYSFEEAVNLCYSVFKNLDKKFSEIFTKLIENGQVDVFPKKGKTGGAFCACDGVKKPTYVLLNFTNKLRDVTTIAHEFGHAINDELMKEKQNELNFGVPLCIAEVSSTFMEDFVFQELMNEADDELKLSLMIEKLNDEVSTIQRQIACYTFEQNLHDEYRKKGYLSNKEIGEIFRKNMESYMGEFVEQSEGSQNWWLYWSHIRRFFYVYSYASGLLISKAMQYELRKNPKFINKVKEFLSAGSSESPKNIFDKLGIDITDEKFWNEGLKEMEELLNETEKLAKKLGKIN
ncbi:M3 family oligoendopeptidase [archaeon]|nr:M3 family oligoendopeptidase [archaeon]